MNNFRDIPMNALSFVVAAILSFGSSFVMAESESTETGEEETKTAETTETRSFGPLSNIGGSFGVGYSTNIYNDYREDRSLSWNLGLGATFKDHYQLFASTGGYRSFDSNRGNFNTDTIVGVRYASLYKFGETGNIGIKGQFTLPTSEYSRNTDLRTALRVELPVSYRFKDINFGFSPKIKKNFHKYETNNSISFTEWVLSLSTWASYSWSDFSTGISTLAGRTVSYQGTVRNSINYSGSIYLSYNWTDSLSTTFSAANNGYYADTERGSLGNLDFFNAADSSFNFDVTYSF